MNFYFELSDYRDESIYPSKWIAVYDYKNIHGRISYPWPFTLMSDRVWAEDAIGVSIVKNRYGPFVLGSIIGGEALEEFSWIKLKCIPVQI